MILNEFKIPDVYPLSPSGPRKLLPFKKTPGGIFTNKTKRFSYETDINIRNSDKMILVNYPLTLYYVIKQSYRLKAVNHLLLPNTP